MLLLYFVSTESGLVPQLVGKRSTQRGEAQQGYTAGPRVFCALAMPLTGLASGASSQSADTLGLIIPLPSITFQPP